MKILKDWFTWFMLIMIGLCLLTGCKSRKVEVQESREKVDSVSWVFKNVDLKKFEREFVFVPVLTDRPMIIQRDTFWNTKIEYRDKAIDSSSAEENKTDLKKDVEEETRNVEAQSDWEWIKKSFPWIAIIVFLVVGYLVFRKLK